MCEILFVMLKRFFVFNLLSVFSLYSQTNVSQVDVAIIGGGCSGLSAAMVLSEYDWKTAVYSGPKKGGSLNVKTVVGNWPGRTTTLGSAILSDLDEQLGSFRQNIRETSVTACNFSNYPFELSLSDGNKVLAKTVLIATGTQERKLKTEGFDLYWEKGIWSNDAFYKYDLKPYLEAVKGKTVVVIGGGIDALRKAVYSIRGGAKKAIILVRSDGMNVDPKHQKMLAQMKEIEINKNSTVAAFVGDGSSLQSVLVKTPEGEMHIETSHVVLAIGRLPNSDLFRGLISLDQDGCIELENGQQSSLPGVFAAGDVTTSFAYGQGAIAAGDGMKAAYEIIQFLEERSSPANLEEKF